MGVYWLNIQQACVLMNKLRLYMSDIESGVTNLADVIRRHAISQYAVIFSLPQISKADEQCIIDDDYESIPVTTVMGKKAVDMAVSSLSDMYVFDDDISRRFVQKFPGLIPLSCSSAVLLPAINTLNEAKANFKAEVQKFESTSEKFFEVHERFRFLITTMAYRKVYAFSGNYKAFYFNWSRRPRVKTQSASEWLDYINRGRVKTPMGYTKEVWNEKLDRESLRILQSGADKLQQRRAIKLRPECSVRSEDLHMQTYSAGLPYFLTEFDSLPKVTHLSDYFRKEPAARVKQLALINTRLHLYARQ